MTLYPPTSLDFSGLSAGINGVNKGLILFFVSYQFTKCMAAADRNASIKRIGHHFAVFFLPFLFWILGDCGAFPRSCVAAGRYFSQCSLARLVVRRPLVHVWTYRNGSRPAVTEPDLACLLPLLLLAFLVLIIQKIYVNGVWDVEVLSTPGDSRDDNGAGGTRR